MIFCTFLVSFVIFLMKLAVAVGSTVFVWLRYFERLPSKEFFGLLIIILVGVVVLSVLVLVFREKANSKSSRYMISTSCAELLSLFFRKPLFRWVYFRAFLPKKPLFRVILHITAQFEEQFFSGLKCRSLFSIRRFLQITVIVSCLQLLRFVRCAVVKRMHSAEKQKLNTVGDQFSLLNLCVKRQGKGWKRLLIFLRVARMKLIKDSVVFL